MSLPKISEFTEEERMAMARRVKVAKDFQLPQLKLWNYDLCRRHRNGWYETYYDKETDTDKKRLIVDRPKPGCRECGIHHRKHQRIGATWLYFVKRGLIADSVGTGKSASLNSLVLTPDRGFVPMGELRIGDAVVDPNGQPSVIDGIFPQGKKQSYLITFSDGTTAESSEDHLWLTRGEISPYLTRVGREPRDGEVWKVEPLSRIMKYKRARAVPLIKVPVDFGSGKQLLIDPYVLGVLLGDGHLSDKGTVSFTTKDGSLADEVSELLPNGHSLSRRLLESGVEQINIVADGRFNVVNREIERLGLRGAHAWEKFVPEEYKLSSVRTRLSVLQGLMDTDGGWEGASDSFSSTSKQLVEDAAWLARSLGFVVGKVAERVTSYTYDNEKKQGRVSYRVSICPPEGLSSFRLERKQAERPGKRTRGNLDNSTGARNRRQHVKWIRSIEPIREPEEHQCISVTAESHLYVTDGFTVTHNTTQAATLIAMIAEAGELSTGKKVVVVCRAQALLQWERELKRMLPRVPIITATGPKSQRIEKYLDRWNILVVGPEMMLRDFEQLKLLDISTVIVDDVDPLRNWDTQISQKLKYLARQSDRFVVMSGTPLQKRLVELYSVLEPLGGISVFGSRTMFRNRYVRSERQEIVTNRRTGATRNVEKIVGYKNVGEFKTLLAPFALRRTAADIEDVNLPTIVPDNVFLELYPAQREKYEELRQGVLRIVKESGTEIKMASAMAKIMSGQKICAGLAALGEADDPMTSIKFDWIMEKLLGDLEDEKVVIFAGHIPTIEALQNRFGAAGIGYETIWGLESNKKLREARIDNFWNNKNSRVLIGTQAIEQSLNLQVARHLINVDQILNPARMEQLAGRIRRDGSAFSHVYVHNLLTYGTQEEGYMPLLEQEQGLIDFVWEEESQLFQKLDPLALLRLITN